MKNAFRLSLVMSVLLAACGGAAAADSVAATVNGEDITVADVMALTPEQEDSVIATDAFRTQLNGVIISLAVLDAAEEQYGLTATEEEIQTQYDEFKTQLEATAETYEDALLANNITDLRVRQAAEEQVVAEALRERLAEEAPGVDDADVDLEFENNDNLYRNACIKHILLESEDEALTVKQQLDDGEDFAELAGEFSIEPQAAETGGDLGCSNLARYVEEFADGAMAAEVGVVSDPVESEFGWHLILVDSIDDDETVMETIRTQLASTGESQFFQDWINEALAAAEVTVDEQYGTWVTDPQPGLVAPVDESDTADTTATTAG